MRTAEIERAKAIVRDIQTDMEHDATRFDGQPFNGRTVAEYFGNQGAAIAALADILGRLLAVPPNPPTPEER